MAEPPGMPRYGVASGVHTLEAHRNCHAGCREVLGSDGHDGGPAQGAQVLMLWEDDALHHQVVRAIPHSGCGAPHNVDIRYQIRAVACDT